MLCLALPFISWLLLAPWHVEAASVSGLTVTLGCTGFDISAFTFTLDRDNTGTGNEAYQIIVTDSANTVVHLDSNLRALGAFSQNAGSTSYNQGIPVPGAVTYKWVSLAGNGLPEQVAYSFVGTCQPPTPTPTPTATPTPAPTATPIAVVNSTLVIGDRVYDVTLKMEVTPGDYVMVGFGVVISGLLMMLIFLLVKRTRL